MYDILIEQSQVALLSVAIAVQQQKTTKQISCFFKLLKNEVGIYAIKSSETRDESWGITT